MHIMNTSPKSSNLPKSGLHQPVLLQAALNYLQVGPSRRYIDATVGTGGHTAGILSLGGLVLGLDQDPTALATCATQEALQPALASGSLLLARTNFIRLATIAKQHAWLPVDGILADLGLSSVQLDTPIRGFSFQTLGPLDMRMDPDLSITAATLVNDLPKKQLAGLLADFGEIPTAATLANQIIAARPITTTSALAAICGKWSRTVFQALRIAVNDELGSLSALLDQSLDLLAPLGRLVIISFHSLEDRAVKRHFSSWATAGLGEILTPKPVTADFAEVTANPRSKSAKLRAFMKTKS